MYINYPDVLNALWKEFPKAKVVSKESSRLMRLMAWLIKPWSPDFLTEYTTTIGSTIYMPDGWGNVVKAQIVNHEMVHIRQFKKWNILYFLSYLFCLPAVWTMRSVWEYEAYVKTMEYEALTEGDVSDQTIDWLVETFAGPSYFFMNPFRGRIRAKLLAERSRIHADLAAGIIKRE